MNRRGMISGFGSLMVAGLFAASGLVSGSSLSAAPQTSASVADIDPHTALGSKTAPMVIEVFSDFQCPACKSLYDATNRQLMDNYVNTGKVYLIHRDFPATDARAFEGRCAVFAGCGADWASSRR